VTADAKISLEVASSLAAVCLALGFWIRRKEVSTRGWPQTSGTIVTSRNQRQYAGAGREEVLPIIEYEFEYNGKLLKSSHWRIGNYSVGNSNSAQAVTSRYPVGTSVTVYVNPDNPTNSVLEHGATPLSWIPIGFGIAFIFLSMLALLAK
jgi:hypothetical protein